MLGSATRTSAQPSVLVGVPQGPLSSTRWWWRQRLGVVRGYARHVQRIDPLSEVPAAGLIHAVLPRSTPYMFTDDDINAVMNAADRLAPTLRSATYSSLIGLLALTGMRYHRGTHRLHHNHYGTHGPSPS